MRLCLSLSFGTEPLLELSEAGGTGTGFARALLPVLHGVRSDLSSLPASLCKSRCQLTGCLALILASNCTCKALR